MGKDTVTITMDTELRPIIAARAKMEHRSMSSLIQVAVEYYIKNKKDE